MLQTMATNLYECALKVLGTHDCKEKARLTRMFVADYKAGKVEGIAGNPALAVVDANGTAAPEVPARPTDLVVVAPGKVG